MRLTIGSADSKQKILWDESKSERENGGFSLADELPSSTLVAYLLKGAPIAVDYDTRVAHVVKTAAIVGGSTAAPTIKIGHAFKVSDVISDGVVALEISVITSGAVNDTLSFTSGTLNAATAGIVLFEAASTQTSAGGVAALATVQDTAGDYLVATVDIDDDVELFNGASLTIAQAASDVLSAAFANGTLTISLADTTASKNNLSLINALITAMGTVEGYDLTKLTFTGTDWDDKQTGSTLTTATDEFDSGINQNVIAAEYTASGLLSDNTKNVGTLTLTLVTRAVDVDESNLDYPLNAAIKAQLGANFKFV